MAESNGAVAAPHGQGQEEMLELSTLNGRTLKITVESDSTVRQVKQCISAELNGMYPGLLRIIGAEGEVDASLPVLHLRGQALTLLFRGTRCVPFHDGKVPHNSLVLVDGIPAMFDVFTGGWGSSSKIRFQFNQGEQHPKFAGSFQTKDWMTDPRTGIVRTRGGDELEVLHVLPENSEVNTWQVIGGSALVRTAMSLESGELGRLSQHDVVSVEEGGFLDDVDGTPRLRISSPMNGWVTPYLSSMNLVLMKPLPEAMESYMEPWHPLRRMVQFLAEKAEA
mmetsp:Transcript_17765/g.31092  ORF Transcript_17765/g.31092 Transcript_17765/m.31092 type:complete len:280 (+) Transcript_17765:71-910(+)